MAVDERSRKEMHDALERAFGPEAAATVMEHLPPVGWADVATKQDLASLENGLRSEFRAELRSAVRSQLVGLGAIVLVMHTALFAALRLA